jgi:hypothetical protein
VIARAFRLRVYPQDEREFGIALDQLSLTPARNNASEPVREVVRAWGPPLRGVTDQLLETLRRSGYRPSELRPERREPFALEEPIGVRLGLLLLAVKPLRKQQRIEEVAAGVRALSDEEAYYWYSKCTDRRNGRKAQHALRVMFSKET